MAPSQLLASLHVVLSGDETKCSSSKSTTPATLFLLHKDAAAPHPCTPILSLATSSPHQNPPGDSRHAHLVLLMLSLGCPTSEFFLSYVDPFGSQNVSLSSESLVYFYTILNTYCSDSCPVPSGLIFIQRGLSNLDNEQNKI